MTPHFQAIELESDKNTKGIEEERRLFYVAMTRAKDSLKISYNNDGKFSDSSRFLKEL
ncbi:3'-5' exonuclease [Alkalibacterium thalassium]|uniref:3'-5' exonuclease n=1 Tax=Alkalibacterium thalassium TaxID=426701 RepID=UPI000B817ACC